MNYLYKLVTTENVEINYDTFKKKELIECLATMRDIYFSLKQENQQLKEVIDKTALELANIDGSLSNSQLSDRICNLIDILKEV